MSSKPTSHLLQKVYAFSSMYLHSTHSKSGQCQATTKWTSSCWTSDASHHIVGCAYLIQAGGPPHCFPLIHQVECSLYPLKQNLFSDSIKPIGHLQDAINNRMNTQYQKPARRRVRILVVQFTTATFLLHKLTKMIICRTELYNITSSCHNFSIRRRSIRHSTLWHDDFSSHRADYGVFWRELIENTNYLCAQKRLIIMRFLTQTLTGLPGIQCFHIQL